MKNSANGVRHFQPEIQPELNLARALTADPIGYLQLRWAADPTNVFSLMYALVSLGLHQTIVFNLVNRLEKSKYHAIRPSGTEGRSNQLNYFKSYG